MPQKGIALLGQSSQKKTSFNESPRIVGSIKRLNPSLQPIHIRRLEQMPVKARSV